MEKDLDLEYAVAVGDGEFPFDMLRYDRCFPNCEHGAWLLAGDEDEKERVVILARYQKQPGPWTPARWSSFGWTLIVYANRGFERLEDAKHAAEMLIKTKEGA